VIVLCFYPGTLNNDSEWQLTQAINNIYFDGHPPIMSYLWHILNMWFPRTADHGANLFLFNAIIFSFALILIGTAHQSMPKKRLLFISLSLIFLPMLCIIGFIIKDALMAVMLLFFYALMLHAEQRQSKILYVFAIFPLFIAFATRYNAIFAIIPFAIWYVSLFFHFFNIPLRKYLQISCIIFLSFSLCAGFVVVRQILETDIIHTNKSFAAQFLLAYDLVGVSVRADKNVLPEFYTKNNAPFTMDMLKNMYRPYSNYYVFWGDTTGETTLPMVANLEQEKMLMHYWLQSLKNYPKEMAAHKIETFFSALGLTHQYYQLKAHELLSFAGIPWNKIVPNIVMDGWMYLLILSILILFKKEWELHQKILAWSGFLYGTSWILVTPNAEQRYFFWIIMSCTILMLNLAINQLSRTK
jgi:hypothetical protein